MPNSSPHGKELIKDWFGKQTNIVTILDIGPGMGTYRQLLGKLYSWKAIEVWEPYIEKYHLENLYDEIVVGDVKEVEWPQADCIILGDVVEHLPKEDALWVLEKALKEHNHVVLSIPLGEYPQGDIENNPYEKHLSTWGFDEIKNLTTWVKAEKFVINPLLPEVMQIGIFIK